MDTEHKRGILYCVGVGPGDTELMTLKAVRLIQECPVIAFPQGDSDVMVAKNIISPVVSLQDKETMTIYMPMTKDAAVVEKAHREGTRQILAALDAGKDVVFITLGCPTVYATCIYIHKLVRQAGYVSQLVPGVTSFCAVAARLNTSLCEKAEPLVILPGSYHESHEFLDGPGNKILMKSASEISQVKEALIQRGLLQHTAMVERCGLPGEAVYRDLEEIRADSSYFSIFLVKPGENMTGK